jgi:adenylosuccinate synthase
MPIQIIAGMQWGDEGKGRAVDLLSEKADIVARFNGGDNAGHTVTWKTRFSNSTSFPPASFTPTQPAFGQWIGVISRDFDARDTNAADAGIQITPQRLWISDAVHFITPAHRLLDQAQESARGKSSIGTTGRGIGPAYMDKCARRGIRAGDLLQPEVFKEKVLRHFEEANRMLTVLYGQPAMDIKA